MVQISASQKAARAGLAGFPWPSVLTAAVGLAAMAALAGRLIAPVHFTGGRVDLPLVISALLHALLGSVLVAFQWCAGAGLARLFLRRESNPPLCRLMLVGFPLAVALTATASYVTIMVSWGWIIAIGTLAACFLAFVLAPTKAGAMKKIFCLWLSLTPMAVILGCWAAFLLHGPTATLPGQPFGDVGYYAANIYALQVLHFPPINLANEGEYLIPFNNLHSLLGAAIIRFVPIDPFEFVLASGASMYVTGLGTAIYAYLSLRPAVDSRLALVILATAVLVSTWYPLWIVSSTPMIIALPLTVSVWYQATTESGHAASLRTFSFAAIGTALGKVSTFVTLGPLALAPLWNHSAKLAKVVRQAPPQILSAMIVLVAAGACYAAWMLVTFGPSAVAAAGFGPDSYERLNWIRAGALPRWMILPYLMRDIGSLLLVVLALRMLTWNFAIPLVVGLVATLVLPFALRVNLDCALIILALAGIDHPDRLRKNRILALGAFLLCLPVIVHQDYGGGHPMSAIWLLCLSAMSLVVFAHAGSHLPMRPFTQRNARVGTLIFALIGALGLVAVGRQQVVFSPRLADDPMTITPAVRDIWAAVREKTPPNALIFTDQTGTDSGALASWNTYATTGQRQIYLAGWYQTGELRFSPEALRAKLRTNSSVLAGETRPNALSYRRGPYGAFYAVVSVSKEMPRDWRRIYTNNSYSLYRYASSGTDQAG